MNPKLLKSWIFFLVTILLPLSIIAKEVISLETIAIGDLPPQARHTLVLIKRGGPFPYSKDGAIFGNYEGVLPKQKRGYYHEFTVKTKRARNRGARRIVVGGQPPQEYYYTDDHYATFRRIKE
ncbi:MAG TPA: ribonuclease [Burkholderiaceae bacterium]|nr:ribonuclease [Burkholderiaceae bacterium]